MIRQITTKGCKWNRLSLLSLPQPQLSLPQPFMKRDHSILPCEHTLCKDCVKREIAFRSKNFENDFVHDDDEIYTRNSHYKLQIETPLRTVPFSKCFSIKLRLCTCCLLYYVMQNVMYVKINVSGPNWISTFKKRNFKAWPSNNRLTILEQDRLPWEEWAWLSSRVCW